MITIRMKRVLRRIGDAASFRREISLAWQVGIVLLLIAVLGGYAMWAMHGMQVRHEREIARMLHNAARSP